MDKDTVAVIGMSIKTAGADDLDEFAEMLKTGQSQHEPVAGERLLHNSVFREAADSGPSRKFYGCFVRDPDAFDHKFFKRSPRESAAIDPQSRLVLQAAYQAVEQSGYFTETTRAPDTPDKSHVGVYVGSCDVDYEHNSACYEPNAFTTTGVLKGAIPGRVSHYFGWTGPSITFDTACSSSSVAIHTACRSVLSGECSAALAGGSNLITNTFWHQNLSAGGFVSPTGQCRPFDDAADGYCRGEAIAFVLLKRLSDALRDGNPVLAIIPGSAVYQNQNCTPFFVPNAPSLTGLFEDVMRQAGVAARDISLVEAHGTGTSVGDPAEYASIRAALGGRRAGRDKKLPIGSVKGHIGHTEGASGAAALVKIIVMMLGGFIPPQASFAKLSRNIDAGPDDMMEVVTELRPWPEEPKMALLNNYGASGNNASLIVARPPRSLSVQMRAGSSTEEGRYPFWIAGLDNRAIAAYAAKLSAYLQSCPRETTTIADLSFNMNRQSNPSLAQTFIFSCGSVAELQKRLQQAVGILGKEDAAAEGPKLGVGPAKPERPVILCFGGQVSLFVGLDRKLFESTALLRKHLDDCDSAVRSLGLGSIYPDIFTREPVRDTVKLQTMLFAMQYACAKSWLECGLQPKVAAVVGHSFGEITALCVAGVLSLEHSVKLVAARARLVRDAWGVDPGAMMAVEADEALVRELLHEANRRSDGSASIACYNGPRSFTIAGSTKAIDAVQDATTSHPKFAATKSKRLGVTNAFHSALVDNLVNRLGQVGRELTFHEPAIPVERATETPVDTSKLDWTFVPRHMREPVFFHQAVQRLAKRHPHAIFLEAGSNSTITAMASKALAHSGATLNSASPDTHHFQAVSITTDTGFDGLTDATVSLWKQGLRVSFWPHHASQTLEYAQLLLPPYQFDKSSRHWLAMKSPQEVVEKAARTLVASSGINGIPGHPQQDRLSDPEKLSLWHFVGYQDKDKRKARFRINTESDKYKGFVLGHVMAQTAPICPGTLQVDVAIEAAFSLHPGAREGGVMPALRDLVNHTPICVDPTSVVYLDLTAMDEKKTEWAAHIFSVDAADEDGGGIRTHSESRVYLCPPGDAPSLREFAQYERFVSHARCQELLGLPLDADGVEVLQGRNVYRAFAPVLDYTDIYRGIRYMVGRGQECAALVQLGPRPPSETWLDTPLSDCFGQVGGIWVNLMTDLPPGDMYIGVGCELFMRSPQAPARPDTDAWHVYARHTRQGDKGYMSDVFVFDAATGQLAEVMLGVSYGRVAKASLSKMLARMTTDASVLRTTTTANVPLPQPPATNASPAVPVALSSSPAGAPAGAGPATRARKKDKHKKKKASSGRRDVTDEVRELLARVSGIEVSEIGIDSELADFGIDSLMGMELCREAESSFKCKLDQAELMEATNVRKFVACVSNALFGAQQSGSAEDGESSEDGQDEGDDGDSSSAAGAGGSWTDLSAEDGGKDSSGSESRDSGVFIPPEPKGQKAKPAAGKPLVTALPPDQAVSNLTLSASDILESFGEVKLASDKFMREYQIDQTDRALLSGSNRLCVALVVEAFDELGSPLRTAAAGQQIDRVPFVPEHACLMQLLYQFLEQDARLIDIDPASGRVTRTHIAVARKPSHAILQEELTAHPEFAVANRLAYYAGTHLAGVLSGKTDGIRVLFGSPEGRELTAAMYREYPLNRMQYAQMRDVVAGLASRIHKNGGTREVFKVMEMGAGTGATTLVMAPLLASLEAQGIMRVEYTFTDLSSSMVANARRRFGNLYPFMRFAVCDIEKPPPEELRGQHLVLATQAVHATHNLALSASNMRQALRPDGFLMIAEMTEILPCIDLVFGMLKGWWLFDDGRKHTVVTAEHWERDLHAGGFGHVDWTDGSVAENDIQKVILALASGPQGPRLPKPAPERTIEEIEKGDVAARTAEAERLVAKYSDGWATPALRAVRNRVESEGKSRSTPPNKKDLSAVVLVTGGTGSLGSHLVQRLAEDPMVAQVVCLNRRCSSGSSAVARQQEAFVSRGIALSPGAKAKLRVLETDTTQAHLGLQPCEYAWLVENGTHIVHNAWPMSSTRPLGAFEPQLQAMRNLLDLARDMATREAAQPARIGFQFVSSIGVVGYAGEARVPERRVPLSAVLPNGYGEAKWVCERVLDETLHKFPELFRPMVVRPGQISGSSTSGYWNPVEHFAFLVKSAQSLRAWPDLDGVLEWIPVDQCAGVMVDLLKIGQAEAPESYPVYHIDNPVGQQWKDMSPVLGAALGIPPQAIIPFRAWIKKVRRSPLHPDTENPAARVVDFLDNHFELMSCGGMILDTANAKEHSETMARIGPVSPELARLYVTAWKKMGFLNS
jgi:acyl transferase domain-containing protein/thioester reductase-like protein/acyl carrier protein/SAM-dependent methyltransferase